MDDNPGDCHAAAEDTRTTNTTQAIVPALEQHEQQEQQKTSSQQSQVSSVIHAAQSPPTAATAAAAHPTKRGSKTPSPPPTANNNNNNGNGNGKTKSQQQQQPHQFRAPQQFVKQRRSAAAAATAAITKKGKMWNKRPKISKQQQQLIQQQHQQQQLLLHHQQQQQQNCATGNAIGISGSTNVLSGSAINPNVAGGVGAIATAKANIENIQNFKNQLSLSGGSSGGGGGGGNYYYYHHHHHPHSHPHNHPHAPYGGRIGNGGGGGAIGAGGGVNAGAASGSGNGSEGRGNVGNNSGLPNVASLTGIEKVGYGHGHGTMKQQQQLYKKMAHRSHHSHVLCAGAAHNSLGSVGANHPCCLVNGCTGQNVKDIIGVNGNNGTNPALHFCCARSKFFLPDNRPRKEVIIPPTKFLLGGNISDPLNLNSLPIDSESCSNNTTPATTPRRSPITTPPKVEVIIPPNIHDPLHLLDPVDSSEYEKQLTSPMKHIGQRNMGLILGHIKPHKHRHRKNRKRRRHDSSTTNINNNNTILANSSSAMSDMDTDTSSLVNSAISTEAYDNSNNSSLSGIPSGTGGVSLNMSTAVSEYVEEERKDNLSAQSVVEECLERNVSVLSPQSASSGSTTTHQHQQLSVNVETTSSIAIVTTPAAATTTGTTTPVEQLVAGDMLPRERPERRDLRLELNSASSSTCGSVISGFAVGSAGGGGGGGGIGGAGGGGGRKRKISESTNNSQKNKKFHRMDSMDKIVSPVVPQPGAWKRPPRQVPSGPRKPTIRRSISVSETDLHSPPEEIAKPLLQLEADTLRVDTPTIELNKFETNSEVGVGSPLSSISGATSLALGDNETLVELNAAGENSTATSVSLQDGDSSMTTTAAPVTATKLDAKTLAAAAAATTTETPTVQPTKTPKCRPKDAKYRYGNYDPYSGYRNLNELMDVRLEVFRRHPELFQNKDILDVGCNAGHMTISVGRSLAPKSILGVDIDRTLVERARRNLTLYVRIPVEQTQVQTPKKVEKVEKAAEEEEKKASAVGDTAEMTTAGEQPNGTTTKIEGNEVAAEQKPKQQEQQQSNKRARRKRRKRGPHFAAAIASTANPAAAAAAAQHLHHVHHHHHLMHHHVLHHHHHHVHQHQLMNEKQQQLHVDAKEFFPVSFPLTLGGIPSIRAAGVPNTHSQQPSPAVGNLSNNTPGHASNASQASIMRAKSKNPFPENVFFRTANYVLKDESLLANDTQQYDLILCLSVTKWIHLNFGDAGLKLAFKRMFNQLRPGGKLILEAQNWASYKKKKNLTEDIYNNYCNIEFYPNKFHEYLLSSEVGFSHSYTLAVPRHMGKGFCRPILLYAKGDYTPNHVRWSDAYYPQTPFEAYRGIYANLPSRPRYVYPTSSVRSQPYDTPRYNGGASSSYTPMHQYNPLETDSYQPSYDIEYMNHHMYVFASPLYQTVWSPPASLRNSSSHTPVFGSVREAELDGDGSAGGGGSYHRHVYPPNDDTCSPNANVGGAFNSIRDPDTDDSNQLPMTNGRRHVYATNVGESSSSPQVLHSQDIMDDGLMLDDEPQHVVGVGSNTGSYCDLNDV